MSSESPEVKVAEAMKKDANINSFMTIDGKQLSQFMVACLRGNIDLVKALLKVSGMKVDLQNDEGSNALMYASAHGHTEIAKLILNTCPHLNQVADKKGLTPLMIATCSGHTETTTLLIQNQAHVNMQDDKGWSPLMFACNNGHTEIASILLQNGARVNMDIKGWSPLMFACDKRQARTVSLLLKNGACANMNNTNGLTSLMLACYNGDIDIASLLLQNHASVNMQNNMGLSPLIFASMYGRTEIVILLLNNGAHVNMQSREGMSSLMLASDNGHSEVALHLLQNGAQVNLQDNKGSSSLMCATKMGHMCFQLRIASEANLNLRTNKGYTALMLAIRSKFTDMALYLIDSGADTNMITVEGSSALSYACKYNLTTVVQRILIAGETPHSTIDTLDEDRHNPLMIASSHGNVEIANLLLEAGAKVNISNFSDFSSLRLPFHEIPLPGNNNELDTVHGSALDIAVIKGHVEIVACLLQYSPKIHNIYYLLRSIILKRAQVYSEGVTSFMQMVRMTSNSGDADWGKYYSILNLLFSHDSSLIGRVECTKPSTLCMACAFGVLQMVSLLIESGIHVSDLYRTDDSGSSYWCSLITIISSGSLLSAAASRKTSNIADLLCHVNWVKYSSILLLLIESGLDVNHRDSSGSFALGIASREGHANLVSLLLKSRANVNLQDKEGISSLMMATVSRHREICCLLLEYNAKIDLLDNKGWSALLFAVADGNTDLVVLLLEGGAEINLQDASGTSSLMLSCFSGDMRVTKVLLGHGADINLQNEEGITALMMSSYNGHTEIVELLLDNQADVRVMTTIGMTALRFSTENGHTQVNELLREHDLSHCAVQINNSQPLSLPRKRDSGKITATAVKYDSSSQEARLEKIEQILQSLTAFLQNQPTDRGTPTLRFEKVIKPSEKPTLPDAFRALCPLAYDWQNIGILLKLENNSLKEIDLNCKGKARDCLRETLNLWLVRAIPPPTWEELAEAVEPTDQTIAHKIRKTN